MSIKFDSVMLSFFRLKLKKVVKNTRPLIYDFNQIPYNYTVEVINRFKGLYLVDRMPEELWMEVRNIIQKAMTKTIPRKKKCKKAKWLSEEALQIDEKKRNTKGKGERVVSAELQRIEREIKTEMLKREKTDSKGLVKVCWIRKN